jgi:hypothetical protein
MTPDLPDQNDRRPGDSARADYGYDMAHEATEWQRSGRHREPRPESEDRSSAADSAGDYGYDEAHDF